tara:strand:- start:11829 stop:12089 length:261 start_codon:yes stop_codon:yes gene_type:complete
MSEDKIQFMANLAEFLVNTETVMSGYILADFLNLNDFSTERGDDYRVGAGMYKFINRVQEILEEEGSFEDAENVEKAFVKIDGSGF